jgi:hypothetical protein
MKTYKITYSGNASRFRDFEDTANANSAREAVEDVFQKIMDENYFPQEDGSIKDCDGHTIADADDDCIEYDGGYFEAEIIPDFYIICWESGRGIRYADGTEIGCQIIGNAIKFYSLDEAKTYLENCGDHVWIEDNEGNII